MLDECSTNVRRIGRRRAPGSLPARPEPRGLAAAVGAVAAGGPSPGPRSPDLRSGRRVFDRGPGRRNGNLPGRCAGAAGAIRSVRIGSLPVPPRPRPAPSPRRPPPVVVAGSRDDAGRDPVPLAEALDSALPRPFQGRLLDLELLRQVWREAVGPGLADAAFPVGFERGVVTIRAAAPEVARSLDRRRAALRTALLAACRLPNASLRIRVVSAPQSPRSRSGGDRPARPARSAFPARARKARAGSPA